MKNILIGLITLSLSATAFASGNYGSKPKTKVKAAAPSKVTFKVSPSSSTVKWVGTKVTGKHDGTINVKNGSMVFRGTEWVGGEFVIDMTSINTTDLSGEWKKKLDDHLKNDDFFSVDKYKTATLKIKDVTFGKGGKYDVFGDLTIKGKTKPISFRADISKRGGVVKAKGEIVIDRTAYGVKYGSGKFFSNLGDKMIHDKFTLNVSLVAKK